MNKTTVTKDLKNKTLIIERSFKASRERVWQAYANKDLFERWWGPEGWETTTKEFNFKPRGRIHYGMKCVDKNQGDWFGKFSWGIMDIQAVDEPNSFTSQDYFSDETGTINKEMPSQTFTVQFIEQGNMTRVITSTVTETSEQLEQLIKMGMVEGFDSQLNKLEKLLQN